MINSKAKFLATPSMLVSLTNTDPDACDVSASVVGGKASSLSRLFNTQDLSGHIPKALALSVEFFQDWVDIMTSTSEWLQVKENARSANGDNGEDGSRNFAERCSRLKGMCRDLPLSDGQRDALERVQLDMKTWPGEGLAAVRSSAPEEDGISASYAGAFDTILGVTAAEVEDAVRVCFASLFDYRVFSYTSTLIASNRSVAFAVVVMEMVDARIAGVAFSANPLNSDRDEMVVDSSWGLGESVVDGSVDADHYVFDKVNRRVIERAIGNKKEEKRLKNNDHGGVETKRVEELRQKQSTLSDKQIGELAELVRSVESTYGVPMDIEWAYTDAENGSGLKLLQARPITTLYQLDESMMTLPGEPRVLYYDYNIASEATTTTPFTHMDIVLYSKMGSYIMGLSHFNLFSEDPRMPCINASTRQYINMSMVFKFISPEFCSKHARVLDHYLADIFASTDCDRKKYRIKKLPKEVNLCAALTIINKVPLWKLYKTSRRYSSNHKKGKEDYLVMAKDDMDKLKQLENCDIKKLKGLEKYCHDLFTAVKASFNAEMGILSSIIPVFKILDKKRRETTSEEERDEYDALCGGYEGDELMEMNIAMYQLANKLPSSIWAEYDHDDLEELAVRIKSNIDGYMADLPQEFLTEWKMFMQNFGYDGQDQLFISSPRYVDSPEILLTKLSHSVGKMIKDPADTQKELLTRRQEVRKYFYYLSNQLKPFFCCIVTSIIHLHRFVTPKYHYFHILIQHQSRSWSNVWLEQGKNGTATPLDISKLKNRTLS